MSESQKITDEQLVKMLASDDSRWPAALYDNYSSVMYGLIYRIVGSEPVAEEVLKESFLRIKSNIQHYDASRGKFFAWMLNICRTLALNRRVSSDGAGSTGLNLYPDHGIAEKLEPDYKVLIDLLFIQGYSPVEVSEELNIPLGTVRTRSRAAITKLRALMQSEGKPDGR